MPERSFQNISITTSTSDLLNSSLGTGGTSSYSLAGRTNGRYSTSGNGADSFRSIHLMVSLFSLKPATNWMEDA